MADNIWKVGKCWVLSLTSRVGGQVLRIETVVIGIWF